MRVNLLADDVKKLEVDMGLIKICSDRDERKWSRSMLHQKRLNAGKKSKKEKNKEKKRKEKQRKQKYKKRRKQDEEQRH